MLKKKLKNLQKAPLSIMFLWGATKAIGGLAVGLLIAAYYPRWVSPQIGWTLLAAALIMCIPVVKTCWK